MSFTRFPCPGLEHSQFPLRWATVLWHRGSAGPTSATLAERSKKRQLSLITEWQVELTDRLGLIRMRQCRKIRWMPPSLTTGASYEGRHCHRERGSYPG